MGNKRTEPKEETGTSAVTAGGFRAPLSTSTENRKDIETSDRETAGNLQTRGN